jgi:hypothetical protein
MLATKIEPLRFELLAEIEVVPDGDDTVEVISGPDVADLLANDTATSNAATATAHRHAFPDGLCGSGNLLLAHPITLDLAFDVIWSAGNEQHKVHNSAIAIPKGGSGSYYSGYLSANPPPTVDLILRPNPDIARRSVSMTRIWGQTVIIKNIPVRDDSQKSAPTGEPDR